MKAYRHPASGFFAPDDEAEAALGTRAQFGLLHARMPVYRHEEAPTLDKPGSNAVLKNKVAIGTAVGTGLARAPRPRPAGSSPAPRSPCW